MASGSLLVLIADDCVDTVASFGLLMELWGYDFCVAHDGTQTIAVAKERQPNVALIDVAMPGGDGLAVAAAIRSSVPFLWAATGYATAKQRKACLDAGFDVVLIKPVDPVKLQRALAQAAHFVTEGKRLGRLQEMVEKAKRLCAASLLSE